MTVVLDPDAAAVLKAFREAGRPPYDTLTPDEARDLYLKGSAAARPVPPEMASVEDIAIPGPAGKIPARVYRPLSVRRKDGLAPALVFFHGGGWVIGNLDTHDVVCRTLARDGELVVVSVDYRLAPEHPFPAGVDDAIVATRWVAANAQAFGLDAKRISVGGDSAGGNLSAVVALDARDNGPALQGQLLIYPATDFEMTHPSHSEPETSCLLTHESIRWFRDQYFTAIEDGQDRRASPARESNLAGLPRAYVLTAGADPLRDEGDEYAQRLTAAGVPVTYKTYPGQFHGFVTMGKLLPKAGEALKDMGDWLKGLG